MNTESKAVTKTNEPFIEIERWVPATFWSHYPDPPAFMTRNDTDTFTSPVSVQQICPFAWKHNTPLFQRIAGLRKPVIDEKSFSIAILIARPAVDLEEVKAPATTASCSFHFFFSRLPIGSQLQTGLLIPFDSSHDSLIPVYARPSHDRVARRVCILAS